MRLFTSSSKNIIIRSVIGAGVLLAVYYVVALFIPRANDGNDQYQTNVLKAQHYAFDDTYYPYVIVGSSECYRLPVDEIDEDFYNLAFAGKNALNGLKIIVDKKVYPKAVFIEISNSIVNAPDREIENELKLADRLWINRRANRPDFLIYSIGKTLLKKEQNLYDTPVNESVLNDFQMWMNTGLDEEQLISNMNLMKQYTDELMQNGCEIVLVEIPNDPSLYDSQRAVRVREAFREYYPEESFTWFKTDWGDYTTADGIHMGKLSAYNYAGALIAFYKEKQGSY